MKISGVISIVGSVVAVAFGVANFSFLLLVNSSAWDYVVIAIISALLALIGALPGLLLGRLITPQDITPTASTQARDDTPK